MTDDQKLELHRALEALADGLQTDINLSQTRDQHIRASQRLELCKWILERASA